jgi:NhaA family Na+:H+ antiporter
MKKNCSLSSFTIKSFFSNQFFSGIIIFISVCLAMIFANSPLTGLYSQFINTTFTVSLGGFVLSKSLQLWINDGLMTLFFLIIGFEIKRELIAGELSNVKKALFPIFAAAGGMAFPIIIFIAFNFNSPTITGWGIPMSTDIAFTLSLLLLLGKRISKALKVNTIALAIIDDIGALIVIAFFYSASLSPIYLGLITVLTLVMILLNKMNLQFSFIYFLSGIIFWFLFTGSGIHPTISGVLLAFLIPANTKINFDIIKRK